MPCRDARWIQRAKHFEPCQPAVSAVQASACGLCIDCRSGPVADPRDSCDERTGSRNRRRKSPSRDLAVSALLETRAIGAVSERGQSIDRQHQAVAVEQADDSGGYRLIARARIEHFLSWQSLFAVAFQRNERRSRDLHEAINVPLNSCLAPHSFIATCTDFAQRRALRTRSGTKVAHRRIPMRIHREKTFLTRTASDF
ncbi:hypothetical protein OKW26_001326 [Paraburkholderia sp. 32]